METLRRMRFGEDGSGDYFVVMHLFRHDLEGKGVRGLVDPNGVHNFKVVVDTAKRDCHGFVSYSFSRPNTNQFAPKIAYVDGFRPWDRLALTGLYVDDIDAAFSSSWRVC